MRIDKLSCDQFMSSYGILLALCLCWCVCGRGPCDSLRYDGFYWAEGAGEWNTQASEFDFFSDL